jgi:hypothetical protein
MFKLSSALPLFLNFFGRPRRSVSATDLPAIINVCIPMLDDDAMYDTDIAISRAEPCAPIFEVEAIDLRGHARLIPGLSLHEAIRISADFEGTALPGRKPRVYVRPADLSVGSMDV